MNGKTWVFACGNYETQGDELYVKCKDEWTLCSKFMKLWQDQCPDVITGWNTKYFDIPYLVNRFRKILGEKEMKRRFLVWQTQANRRRSVQNLIT